MAKLVDERHAACEADLPRGDDAARWGYLTGLDEGSRLALLAHCLSFGINALHEKVNSHGAGTSSSGLTRRMALRRADLLGLEGENNSEGQGAWVKDASTTAGKLK